MSVTITEDLLDEGTFLLTDDSPWQEDVTDPGTYTTGMLPAGVTSSDAYLRDGYLFVPIGATATVNVSNPSTVVVTARENDQVLTTDVETVVSVYGGENLRAEATSLITLGPGEWKTLTVVESAYLGDPFSGNTSSDGDVAYGWVGMPDRSESVSGAAVPAEINPDLGAYRVQGWPSNTSYFLRVDDGASFYVPAGVTVFITARAGGQQMSTPPSSEFVRSSRANETLSIRRETAGLIHLGPGDWSEPIIHVDGTSVTRQHPINRYGPEWLNRQTVEIVSDTNYGFTLGSVESVSPNEVTVAVQCLSRMGELNIYNVQAQPYVGTLRGAFHYYAELAGVLSDVAVDDIVADRAVALPGFSGELWYHLKQLAAAQDCDISLVSGVILLRPIRSRVAERGRTIQRNGSTGGGSLAQAVEVYWYKTEEIADELVYPPGGWVPEVEVLNVNAGETAEYTLELSSSLSSFQEPVMVTSIDQHYDSSSVYTIVADDGFPVSPADWAQGGGEVKITLNKDTSSFDVRLVGAVNVLNDSGEPSKSFSLALESDGSGARYSTLRIVGTGVRFDRQSKRIRTGISPVHTSTEIGVTIDNPFINDLDSLYRAGTRAAKAFTGETSTYSSEVTTVTTRGDSGEVVSQTAHDLSNQTFGNVQGARIWDPSRKRWFRVRSATTTPSGIRIETADDDLTHDDVQDFFGNLNLTYGEVQLYRQELSYEQERMVGLRV